MNAHELIEAASPVPWVVGATWDYDWPVNRVATMRGETRRELELESGRNAELIARAVNSFGALVDACTYEIRELSQLNDKEFDDQDAGARMARIRAALRIANGTPAE